MYRLFVFHDGAWELYSTLPCGVLAERVCRTLNEQGAIAEWLAW